MASGLSVPSSPCSGSCYLPLARCVLAYGLYLVVTGAPGETPAGSRAVRASPIGEDLPGVDLRVILSLVYSFCLLLAGLQQIAMGALCRLFIHLEENTRAAAQALDHIRSRMETNAEGESPFFRS